MSPSETRWSRGGELHDDRVRDVLVRWEKYRVAYNLVLATAVIIAADRSSLTDGGFWLVVGSRVVLANILFTLGHGVEALAAWLGLPNRVVGAWCFTVGTATSVLLALLVAFFYGWSVH